MTPVDGTKGRGADVGNHRQVETIEGRDRSAGWRVGRKPSWQAGMVFVLGVMLTTALTVSSALSYANNERRLTTLQTRLTATLVQQAQPQLQATLGRVVGLSAAAMDPVTTFRAAMAPELGSQKSGKFASATLAVVQPKTGHVLVLDHVGTKAIRGLHSKATTTLLLKAARSRSLVTSRAVAGRVQKLGYLLSGAGPGGVYVVGASQELPVGHRVALSAASPDANLNFALYFGRSTTPRALVATNVPHLPLTGTTSVAHVKFGNNVLTLVASPRDSLAGKWAQYLPWGILALGLLLSVAAALVTENLVRRRTTAEASYRQQRNMSETLQRSLLPRTMPAVPRWDFAARYVPATKGADIGGDWYSVVEMDDHRFSLVVGDVSGHDIAAAGVMAALRYTIRTLAKLGIPPDEILDRAATELDVSSDRHFATVLIGVVDTRMQQLTLASAGHLPPLMLHDGGAEFVPVAPGVPLGVPGGPRPQPITVHFPPSSTLVAFTDGLVERRDRDLDERLKQLEEVAAESPAGPDELITHLLDVLTSSDEEDDIVVLAIHFSAEEAERRADDPTPPDNRTDRDATLADDLEPFVDSDAPTIRSRH
jgi:serine phosphatase RsbU (regulator of sigma subunit)